jgi:trans-aconitate methyltransferase
MAETYWADLDFMGVQRILDTGCGDGFVTRSIVHRAPEAFVAGVEPSSFMIATAQTGVRRGYAGDHLAASVTVISSPRFTRAKHL